jgi:transposase
MDDVTEIRRRVARGESMRTVAASLGVSRNTVRRYVDGAPPETRRAAATPRARAKQEAIGARFRELLAESATWTAGKQRLIASRLHGLLRAEGHEVGLTLVRALVAEHWRQRQEVFVPLVYHPGGLVPVLPTVAYAYDRISWAMAAPSKGRGLWPRCGDNRRLRASRVSGSLLCGG